MVQNSCDIRSEPWVGHYHARDKVPDVNADFRLPPIIARLIFYLLELRLLILKAHFRGCREARLSFVRTAEELVCNLPECPNVGGHIVGQPSFDLGSKGPSYLKCLCYRLVLLEAVCEVE